MMKLYRLAFSSQFKILPALPLIALGLMLLTVPMVAMVITKFEREMIGWGWISGPIDWPGFLQALLIFSVFYVFVFIKNLLELNEGIQRAFVRLGAEVQPGGAIENDLLKDVEIVCERLGVKARPRVFIVENDLPHAYSALLDQGAIVFTRDWLMDLSRNARRFVIAHELGHVIFRDSLAYLIVHSLFILCFRVPALLIISITRVIFKTFVIVLIFLAVLLSIAFLLSQGIEEILHGFFGGMLEVLSKVVWVFFAGVICVLLLQLSKWYVLLVGRLREYEADRLAYQLTDIDAANDAFEFLVVLERADRPMNIGPISYEAATAWAYGPVVQAWWYTKDEAETTPPKILKVIAAGAGAILWAIPRLPGGACLYRGMLKLNRTHPDTKERLKRLQAIDKIKK